MMRILLGAALLLALSACANRPTKAIENPERKLDALAAKSNPIKVVPETIVIDARSSFDYSTAHVPRSVNLQWNEFSEPEPASPGVLQGDLFAIARRLARVGVGPGVPVVVVGYGLEGAGEEGRLAWMLEYLGVSGAQFSDIDAMKFRLTNLAEENPPKGAPMWKPEPRESLVVALEEMRFAINERAMFEPASFKGAPAKLYRLIDVRPAADYLGREGLGARKAIPNMEAVNVPWKEFFTPSMQVKPDVVERLREVGVKPEHRVIVIGSDGVSSAAVTLALRSFGYESAGNYAGGLVDLLDSSSAR